MSTANESYHDLQVKLVAKGYEIERLKRELANAEEEERRLRRELSRPVPPEPKPYSQRIAEAQAKVLQQARVNERPNETTPEPPRGKTPSQLLAIAQGKAEAKAAAILSGGGSDQTGIATEVHPVQDTAAGNPPAGVHTTAVTPGSDSNT